MSGAWRSGGAAAPKVEPVYTPLNANFFWPEGTDKKVITAFWKDCIAKEKGFAYRNKELAKRVVLLNKMPALVEPYLVEHLEGLSPEIVVEMMVPRDGWQSCHMQMLFDDEVMLLMRLKHLSDWLESHSLTPELLEKQQAYLADKAAIQAEETRRASELAELQERARLAEGMAATASCMLAGMANLAIGLPV